MNTGQIVITTVAQAYGLVPEQLDYQHRREPGIHTLRRLVMYLLREHYHWSLSQIGRLMSRDGSGVVVDLEMVRSRFQRESGLQEELRLMARYLEAKWGR